MRTSVVWALVVGLVGAPALAKGPLNVAFVWHQPLYWDRLSGEYELPWVRVHGVQEYLDSPRILLEFPGVVVTYNPPAEPALAAP